MDADERRSRIMASESTSNNTEITCIFSSSSDEHRWVIQMGKNFEIIDIDKTPCISIVPETLRAEKPEAYAPKRIGLGPYHHFRPDLYDHMERKKLTIMKSAVKPDENGKFPQTMINKLKELEPKLRPCYDKLLDLDGETLAWIWAIDGFYLYQNLCKNFLEQEIFMLENQIPYLVLEEIDHNIDHKLSDQVLRDFCEVHSPLKWTQKHRNRQCKEHEPAHLLDFLYHLVVTDGHIRLKVRSNARMLAATTVIENTATSILEELRKLSDLIKKLHLDKICAPLFKKPNTALEIEIPSVSSLKIAGVKFAIAERGISVLEFDNTTSTLKLPVITLNENSEVVLRNLLAYEALSMPVPAESTDSTPTRKLAEYIDLMCGIIDTAEDVKILQKQNIIVIEGNLSHGQIVDIFNGITKSTDMDKQFKVVEKVNKHYDSMPIVKAGRFIKKCLDSSWNFVKTSWKVLCFFYSLILISVLILQGFCDIYGCRQGQSQNFIFRAAE
ncbi:unnamed protein product [Ilex paraguariensis]|uniref:Uncharacterized protein n=1 Tax=Ilex paraguariensis TaxID=185542 RepID=A0ABC8RUH5_9AQUA